MTRAIKHIFITLVIGMFAGMTAMSHNLPVKTVGNRECYVYEVKKGENIYDVSRSMGVPTVEITRYNPSAADGLRAGMHLYIPVAIVDSRNANNNRTDRSSRTTSDNEATVTVPATRTSTPAGSPAADDNDATTYTVKKNESLYGISNKLNIPMDDLIAMNPSAEYGVKAGDVLVIKHSGELSYDRPTPTTSTMNNTPKPASQPATEDSEPEYLIPEPINYSLIPSEQRLSQLVEKVSDIVGDEPVDTVNMAVMLPLMLNSDPAPKTSQLLVEFYKGLLMAADSLKNRDGHYINIYAYDTEGSVETIESIMRRPEMQSMTLIIGPDNETHLGVIANRLPATATLYNTFNVRSDLYVANANVMQANIPHSPMLNKAVATFVEMYEAYTPVFVSRIDGAADKDAFTSLLKARLDNDGKEYRTITFRNLLSHNDVDTLTEGRNYVFVPVSGARAEFAKMSEAIHRLGQSRPDNSIRIFGYPDWITFRGEYLSRLCELEATIYSRFYADTKDMETAEVMKQYTRLYGGEMLDAAPVQGLLGFDTGMYLLGLLKEYGNEWAKHPDSYTGLQSVMNFGRDDSRGYVNGALMIVTFTPGGNAIKTTIE